jgi:nucleotide-binding universal stress UspA family protein
MKTNDTATRLSFTLPRGNRLASGRRNGRKRAAPVANILVPVDFSTASRQAVEYASTVGKRSPGSMTLLHVVKPIRCQADFGYGPVTRESPDQNEVRKGRARLKRLSLKMAHGSPPAKVLVLSGTAPFEITQAAKALGTDLIIVGCHGKGEAAGSLGSTAEEVVRHAPCPVFVLKRKECGGKKVN